ncbi:MAG: hypothetical protein ACR2I0_01465, partial [Rhodoferax sp.]
CLGSFVFLWEQKQERTPTWYGMFLQSGEKTATVDVMHYLWRGAWPSHPSPQFEGAWLDGKTASDNIRIQAGQTVQARLRASDANQPVLRYFWEVMEESRDLKTGGDPESKPRSVSGLIAQPERADTTLTAPAEPGAYRLFGYAFNANGGAAHVNLPFLVEAAAPGTASPR